MQFEPNWLECFILKIMSDGLLKQILIYKRNKINDHWLNYELFIWVILNQMQELLAICCLALDNGLPVSDNMKVLG